MVEKSVSETELFEKVPIRQALTRMAVPTVISQLIVLIYNMADTYFIGQTNNPYMVAAASLVLPLFNFSNAISNLIGIGAGSLISRLLGQKRDKDASKISAFAVWIALGLGLCWGLVVFLLMTPILNLLGASSETYEYARSYCSMVVVIGATFTIMQLAMSQLVRAVGHSKESGFGIAMGGVLNIILDPLLMFVILPKGYEILGAGLATMLSNFISMLYFAFTIHRLSRTTALRISPKIGLPDKKLVKDLLYVGVPACTANLLFDVSQIMINKLMSGYGDIPLAACGIVLKAERIPLNIGIGICQGMMPIVAYNYSSGNYKRMKETMRVARIAGLVIAIISVAFYELSAPQLIHLFINHEETSRLGSNFLMARALATPFSFANFHYMYTFQSLGDGKSSFWVTITRQVILYIPLLLLMNQCFGMYGLVWTQLLSDGIMVLVSIAIFRRFENGLLGGKANHLS